MTVREIYDTVKDIPRLMCTHFQTDAGDDFIVYWEPESPSGFTDREVYLGILEKNNGGVIKHYFHPDLQIEELDKLFPRIVSTSLTNDL